MVLEILNTITNFINILWIKLFLKGMRYSKMAYFTGCIFPWWIQYITRFYHK